MWTRSIRSKAPGHKHRPLGRRLLRRLLCHNYQRHGSLAPRAVLPRLSHHKTLYQQVRQPRWLGKSDTESPIMIRRYIGRTSEGEVEVDDWTKGDPPLRTPPPHLLLPGPNQSNTRTDMHTCTWTITHKTASTSCNLGGWARVTQSDLS